MKKNGFTLAEVLITLGIIGVVAALTAPALVLSSRNEANASKLSVVVSTLENAFNNAILQEGVDSLFRTKMWQADTMEGFVGQLGEYLVVSSHGDDARDFYSSAPMEMDRDGGVSNIAVPDSEIYSRYRISLKNGASIFIDRTFQEFSKQDRERLRNLGASIPGHAGWLTIDVNGNASPNVVGRDLFMFIVGSNGMLYPRGGSDYAIRERVFGYDTSTWDEVNGRESCIVGSISNGGWGCTARLIAEGYKMNY